MNAVAAVDRSSRMVWSPPAAWLVPVGTAALYVVLLAGQRPFDSPIVLHSQWARMGAVLGVLLIGWAMARRVTVPRVGVLQVGFVVVVPLAYAAATALWNPTAPGVAKAVVELLAMILLCAITVRLCRADPAAVSLTMLWCLVASGVVYAVAGLLTSESGRMAAFGGGPNVYVRITGMGLLALVALILLKKAPVWTVVAAPALIEATVASGSRGGMVALAIGAVALVPLWTRVKTFDRTSVTIGVAGLVVGAVVSQVFLGTRVSAAIDERIVKQTVSRMHTSGRGDLYRDAIRLFGEHPILGGGLRSFQPHLSDLFYPHNVFLHFASEGGLVGVVLLCVALGVAVRTYVRNLADSLTVAVLSCAALVFTAQNFSGDYYDNRVMFVFAVIGVYRANSLRTRTPES